MITVKQKEQRKNHIGGSDIAAILGLSPFANAYDIWLQKTGKLETTDEPTDAMAVGNFLEKGVLDYAESKLGPLKRNQYRSAKHTGLPLAVNCDAIVLETGAPVEAKTSQLFFPYGQGLWGEPGTDAVPPATVVQCHAQMICVDCDYCNVAALVGGKGLLMYIVSRDAEIESIIRQTIKKFWEKNVLADIPPEDIMPSMHSLKRIKREPKSIVDVPKDLVEKWLETKEAEAKAKKARIKAQVELLTYLGKAEAGRYDGGLITYFEQSKRGIDTKKLKELQPDLAEKFAKISKYRVLRNKKG